MIPDLPTYTDLYLAALNGILASGRHSVDSMDAGAVVRSARAIANQAAKSLGVAVPALTGEQK